MTWTFGRAPRGGEVDVINGKTYKGGQLLPFYVPRPIMPQINEVDYVNFLEFLYTRNVAFTRELVDPTKLIPHQRINKFHAEEMTPSILAKPIWVSQDNFILDGNHRWFAHLRLGNPVDCWVIDQDFSDAIDTMFAFPKTECLLHSPETN